MNFRVGQKVVCVDSATRFIPGSTGLVEGAIYTVIETGVGLFCGELWITVAEVAARSDEGFFANRFRPVVERKTDISIFKKMLTPKHERADA
jgi:hypothetical protein